MRPSAPRAARALLRLGGALAGLLLVQGCELAEVTAAAGEDRLVVEGVLRAGDARQDILLHRTLLGGEVRGEPNARVRVSTPEGEEVLFTGRPLNLCTGTLSTELTDSLPIGASCYSSLPGELDVRPGATYELRVETRQGEEVRGRTVVPGDFEFRVPRLATSPGACSLPPLTPLEAVWSSSEGAWSYLASIQVSGLRSALEGTGIAAPEILELTGVAISERDTTLVVPGEMGLFERFGANQEILLALRGGFPRGVRVETVVAAADRNLVNAVRGGGFNPSGNVRISSVVGDGIGVFGSLVPRRLFIAVGIDAGGLPGC